MSDITRSVPLSAPSFWVFAVSVVLFLLAIVDQVTAFNLPISTFGVIVVAYLVLLAGVLFNRL